MGETEDRMSILIYRDRILADAKTRYSMHILTNGQAPSDIGGWRFQKRYNGVSWKYVGSLLSTVENYEGFWLSLEAKLEKILCPEEWNKE